jgi:hypothetical protein
MMVVHPEKTEEVLINPGVGWQMLTKASPAGEMEAMPLVSTFYYRTSWTEFEPEKGRYEDSPAVRTIDAWLAEAARRGRYVAIRVVPWNSRNPDYQSRSAQKVKGYDSPVPAYIFAEGADGFPEPGDAGGWTPVFWDPIYLKYQRKLAEFLGKRYGNHPNLAYVDVPGGNYGEMNLTNTGVPELDDLSLWKKHGLTGESWGGMVRELCDMYRGAFPNDLLVAARDYTMYAGGKEALPYAVSKEVGFRDDGLGMDYCGPGRENREYEQNWEKVLCLYENGGGSWIDIAGARRIRALLDWAIDRTHASIVMVGKGERTERAYRQFLTLVEEYGQRLGYRLVVEEASWPVGAKPGGELPISLLWRNLGNAPPYVDFALEVSLLNGSGKVVCSEVVAADKLNTKAWLPGGDYQVKCSLRLPGGLAAGRYGVAISLFEPRAGKTSGLEVRRRIHLGIQGEEGEARYRLGEVGVE